MSDYTIVEPSFFLLGTPTPDNYMEFLELCTRTCYKSEEKIKSGSAEKLLSKVVKEYKHLSVIEHASAIIRINFNNLYGAQEFLLQVIKTVPLFAHRFTLDESNGSLVLSGNMRMWKEFFENYPPPGQARCWITKGILGRLAQYYPFFFEDPEGRADSRITLETCDPTASKMSRADIMKHYTLTGRFIMSRAASHQLVRHRLSAYSQESMRYCNYGKKGFQFIMPPTFDREINPGQRPVPLTDADMYCGYMKAMYEGYLHALRWGVPPEDARNILPIATKTEVIATYTLNMWKHCIEHRGHNKKAQEEIRELFLEAEKQINEYLGWEVCE